MADDIDIPPLPPIEDGGDPAPVTPAAPAGPKGSAALVAEFDNLMGGEPGKPDQAKPAPAKPAAPAKPDPAKPAAPAKPEPAKPEPAKPEPTKPEPEDNEKDPIKLRLSKKKLQQEYEGYKGTTTQEIASLTAKIKTLESKRVWNEDDNARFQALDSRTKQLEAELEARDFKTSETFKKKFSTRWDQTYAEAVADIKGMMVKYRDGEETKERPATSHDFDRIRKLSESRAEQRRTAKEMFGEDSQAVLDHVGSLTAIEKEANQAIADKRTNYESERQKREEDFKAYDQTYQSAEREVERAIVEKYPHFFGKNAEDAEGTKAFDDGMLFVNETLEKGSKLHPEDRATRNVLIRNWAAAFPRTVVMLKRLQADLEARDAEIAKYRAGDPGSGGEGGGDGLGGGEGKGKNSDGLASEYDNLPAV